MKQKLLSIKALVLVLMMTVGFGQAFAQDVTYVFSEASDNPGNAKDWFTAEIDEYTSWSATKGGNNNPKYYNAGTGLRVYNGGTFTVESTKIIESITLTFSGAGYTFTSSMSNPETQEPNSYSFSWEVSRTCRLQKIEITYSSDPGKTPTTTTFEGEESYTILMGNEFTSPIATVSPDGLDPIYSSSKPEVATVDEKSGEVTLVGPGTTTIIATYEGDETYAPSYDSYTLTVVPVYASLEALAADGSLVSGDIVNVSFQNVEIKSVYVSSGQKRQGIYFDIQKGDKDIEIYYNAEQVPETWVAGGTVSGTMQCPWKNYNGTWELAPDYGTWSWDNLDYVAPSGQKTVATINFTEISNLEVGANANIEVEYNGDGVLEVLSSNPSVAQVSIEGTQVSIVTVAAGTTTITISADETENYTAASKQFTLTVTEPAQPFDRNVHKALVAEKDGKYFAAYNTISGTNKYFVVKEVTVYNNKVYGLSDDDAAEIAWRVDVNGTDATVRNLENKFLTLATTTTASLSSTEVVLYAGEDGGYYYSETGRGFAYNSSAPRMASYTVNNTYSAAKAMAFAAENETLPANMRITSAGWGTFWAPFAVEIPEGVKAYTGELQDENSWIRMNELTDGYIPANTGVVVAKDVTGDAFVAELSAMDPQPNAAAVTSCYTGNESGAVMNVAVGAYLLQKQDDVVGWYQIQSEGFTLAPNRCYLTVPNSARPFIGMDVVDGGATGISSIATEAKTKADGKYMVNGQIVVVKAGKAYNMSGAEIK